MAIRSSILAWKIQWTGEPGELYRRWGYKESGMLEHVRMHYLMYTVDSFTLKLWTTAL